MTSPTPKDNWYYACDKKKVGPVSLGHLRRLLAAGVLKPEDMVFQEGTRKWRRLAQVPGLVTRTPRKVGLWKMVLGSSVALGLLLVLLGWGLLASLHGPNRKTDVEKPGPVAELLRTPGPAKTRSEEAEKKFNGKKDVEKPAPVAELLRTPGPAKGTNEEAEKKASAKGEKERSGPKPKERDDSGPKGDAPVFPKQRPTLVAQLGHSRVFSVAISPDGKQVLTGGADSTARLWDLPSGKELRAFTGHASEVHSVAFAPDGKQALTGSSDKTARLWDAQSGKELRAFTGHASEVHSVAFATDGKQVLTGSWDKTARLWDVQSGKSLRILTGHEDVVWSVAFSPDGNQVLTGSEDKTARLWDAQTGKELRAFTGHSAGVTSVAFSPGGKQVLTGSVDKTARLWDVQTGKQLRAFTGHSDWVSSVAFAPDGEQVLTVTGRSYGPTKRMYVWVSGSNTTRLWNVQTGKELRTFLGAGGFHTSVAFSPDRKHALTGSGDGTARLWDAQTGMELRVFTGHGNQVHSVAFSPDGKQVLTGTGNTPRLWDIPTARELRVFTGQSKREVTSWAFSTDGKQVLTGGKDRSAHLWDIPSGKELRVFAGHATWVNSVAISPDGKRVVTGGAQNTTRLWDTQSGKELLTFAGPNITSVAFSPEGNRVLTGRWWDKTARLWDAQTGKELRAFTGHSAGVTSVAFSPGGKQVLTGSGDGTARLWDAQTGKELRAFTGHSAGVTSVAFSPGGKQVLTGSGDKTARLWDAQSGKEVCAFNGHSDLVSSVAFSPDGKQVLTGSRDSTTRIWKAQTGRELCKLISFTDGSWAVVDSEGRFDAANGGEVNGLHWVVGMEPIDLKQLKERDYDPGLLAKYMGFNKEPLRKVAASREIGLYPEITVSELKPADKKLTLQLTNRGGGIGRVQVLVNGKELLADARGPKPDTDARKATLTVDLSSVHLIPGQPNKVEVVAWNAEGYLSSRGLVRHLSGPNEAVEPMQLHAIVAGVGTYSNSALNLRFAAKDAEDFATALQLGGKRLFGAEKVHLTLLTTSDHPRAIKPTKANLAKAFADLKNAKPGDVLVIYLAGHGVALQQGNDLYCYMTADARSLDLQTLADPAVRAATTVSSEELTNWIKAIPALKQVMVLDTCAAGAAEVKLTEKRDISGDQVRAIERLKDRTGFHVLMGCAADRKSYEASQYAQGLLTYSLLEGMRGTALREGEYVDVSKLFQYAADRVPELARDIGGVQRPLVAAPRGTSFDVGRLGTVERALVPLALVKPVVLQPSLLNRDEAEDNLKLTALLRQRLGEASQPAGRGKKASIVYVSEDEFPGAVRPTGIYTVEGDKVVVQLTLKRDGAVVARLKVEGKKSELSALAEKLAQAVLKAAK